MSHGFPPASVSEGFQRASGKPFGAPAGAYLLPRMGIDAPTTAREWDLPSYGAFTLFFRWRKKSVQKKASGTATPGKSPLMPFLKEGVRNVARITVRLPTFTFVRARAHSFPLSKRARLFPSAAYRRPRPRGRHKAYASLAGWEASAGLGGFRSTDKQQGDLNALRLICNKKGQRGFESMLAFEASQEAS